MLRDERAEECRVYPYDLTGPVLLMIDDTSALRLYKGCPNTARYFPTSHHLPPSLVAICIQAKSGFFL